MEDEELEYGYKLIEATGRRVWWVRGPKGGIHIWAHPLPDPDYCGAEYLGGVEVHSMEPMEYYIHNERCWLLDGPCWHDGSSLAFDKIEPIVRRGDAAEIEAAMRDELTWWYERQFEKEK